MKNNKINIATCQFAVSGSIRRNATMIRRYIRTAKDQKADVVHFSECALSGYAGFDHDSPKSLDWQELKEQTRQITALAGQLRISVILGSTHQLTKPNKPHNCLYFIGADGRIKDRYDKRFCTPNDLVHYSPGDHFVTFDVNRVKCALLICFDLRFPELYRQLKRQNVECVFQSFYNAKQIAPSVHNFIMQPTMQAHAATNYFWISLANSSARYAPYSSCFIRPDGYIEKKLPRNQAGLMVNTVNTKRQLYHIHGQFTPLALKGKLSNGPKIKDARSSDRKAL